jgi:hypothetical protein
MSTGAYPFGGTALGIMSEGKWVEERQYAYGASEALGRAKATAYGGNYAASLAAVLVQYDTTILNLLYANDQTSAGGYQGANRLSLPLPGRNVAPGPIAPNGSALLFVADDYLTKPSLIVYAPIFLLPDPKLERDLALNKAFEHALLVIVGLDSTQRDYQCALLGDMSV